MIFINTRKTTGPNTGNSIPALLHEAATELASALVPVFHRLEEDTGMKKIASVYKKGD